MFFILCFLFYAPMDAASSTPTDSLPTPDVINQLKERIASRVAQLKLVERRGIIGTVGTVSNTQISISDLQGNIRLIDVDELTKFSSPKSSEAFGISDIAKKTTIGVLGLYNRESQRMLGRFINVITLPQFVHGTINFVDKDNYAINVSSDSKKQITVDIENTTKTFSYTKDADLVKSGFSKIKPNEKVFVAGVPDIKNPDHLIGLRVIRFPEIKPDPNILLPSSTESAKSSE